MYLKSLKQKALITAVIAAFAQPALANDECNAGDGLNSWSAWCGIDTYLSQQEPTAAGPIQGGGFSGLNNRSLNTNEFGGTLNDNEANTAEFVGYSLNDFFMFYGPAMQKNGSSLRETILVLDDDNQSATMSTSLNNGPVLTSQSNYYDRSAQHIRTGNRPEKDENSLAIAINNFWSSNIYTEQKYNTDINQNLPEADIKDFTYGYVYHQDSRFMMPFMGNNRVVRTTDLVDMNSLKEAQATANFYVQSTGYDSKVGYRNEGHSMFVDFGQGTWNMNNFYSTNATGSITGNKFVSTSITATNTKKISDDSFVKGAFTGTNASNLTGMANIVKLKANNKFHKDIKVVLDGYQSSGQIPK